MYHTEKKFTEDYVTLLPPNISLGECIRELISICALAECPCIPRLDHISIVIATTMLETTHVTDKEMVCGLGSRSLPNGEDLLEKTTFHGDTSPLLPELNIGQLLTAQNLQHPDRVALVSRWQNQRLTYRELHDMCKNAAQSLLFHGVRPGDHVVVLAGNMAEYAELFLAVGAIGAIFAIINPTFTKDEVLDAVKF